MTLRQFCRKAGNQIDAARHIGVPLATLSRWLNRHNSPSPMMVRRMQDLGIHRF